MINKISIDNFRGLKHIDIDGMNRISLLSGKNNVGKSSVLEAVFLYMYHTANNSFTALNRLRGSLNGEVFNIWESMFFNMDMDTPLSIRIYKESGESELQYKKDMDYLPRSMNSVPEEMLVPFRVSAKDNYSLSFTFKDGDYSEKGHFFANADGVLRQMSTNLPGNELQGTTPTSFINSLVVRAEDDVIDSVGKLELDGNKKVLIEIMRELDPAIEDIVTISRKNVSRLHVRIGQKWIPLQYAGDGVMKLLHICLSIMERPDGLLLIDEIETGFHYSMYAPLWRIIDKISKKFNCQIIATTHSYEMISALNENHYESDDFVYYRLGKSDDGVNAFRYDSSMLDSALSFEMEVR